MSLFKQIQVLITVLLIVMLTIVMKINFDRARDFTAIQLYNNAKNTANVLALSLGSSFGDEAIMESSINAMFDGGYYAGIELVGTDGEVLINRHEAVRVDGVPLLFIEMVKLELPVAEARVMNGWTIQGVLKVTGHPGHAYMRLWDTFKQLCITFVLIGGAAFAVGWGILKFLLRSLVEIRQQAEAVSSHEFIFNASLPATPELREVVIAMNTMVGKVKTIFTRQLQYIKEYQDLHFKEANTGMHNRAYFVKQLTHFFESDSEKSSGGVLILSLEGIEKVGISFDHPAMLTFYKGLARLMDEETSQVTGAVIARLSQQEFAVILPGCVRRDAMALSEAIMARFKNRVDASRELSPVVTGAAGLALYDWDTQVGALLSQADYALSVSKTGAPWCVHLFSGDTATTLPGKYEWKQVIEEAFENRRFLTTAQPVISDEGELHREVYVTLSDASGTRHRAGYFMPMVITLGYAARLDRYVLEEAVVNLSGEKGHVFAVNITRDFCRDRESFQWFRTFLLAHQSIRKQLVFEFQEGTLLRYPHLCMDLAGLLRGMGYGFGLDQCTLQDASLAHLKDLKPDYIKVDVDCLVDGESSGQAEVPLNALVTVTDSLGIKLIASKVEDEAQAQMLTGKNIVYFQGKGIAGIQPSGRAS